MSHERPDHGVIALVITGRKDHHHSRHWRLVVWSKRPLRLVADRRKTFEIVGDRAGVGFRQSGERAPRHDRSEDSPIWPNAGLNGRDDLVPAPASQSRFVVRREVRTDECAQTRQVETDVGNSGYAGNRQSQYCYKLNNPSHLVTSPSDMVYRRIERMRFGIEDWSAPLRHRFPVVAM